MAQEYGLFELSVDIEEMMDLAATAQFAKSEEEYLRIEKEVMERRAKIQERAEMLQRSKKKSRKRGR